MRYCTGRRRSKDASIELGWDGVGASFGARLDHFFERFFKDSFVVSVSAFLELIKGYCISCDGLDRFSMDSFVISVCFFLELIELSLFLL